MIELIIFHVFQDAWEPCIQVVHHVHYILHHQLLSIRALAVAVILQWRYAVSTHSVWELDQCWVADRTHSG